MLINAFFVDMDLLSEIVLLQMLFPLIASVIICLLQQGTYSLCYLSVL